jgi:hypothetical protein
MQEYRIKKVWAIFTFVSGPLMIIVFAALLFLPFFPGMESFWAAYWFMGPVSVAMIVVMVIGVRDAAKGKFVIDHDRIYNVATFANRSLMFDEIKGYRVNDKFILIEPVDKSKKRIKLNTYLERTDEIIAWLSSRYPDLDVVNYSEEREAILQYAEFGGTAEQREVNLKQAKRIATGVNIVGGLAGAWTLFFPRPYAYAVMASIIMPIIALVVIVNFSGLIRINEKKGSAFPSILYAVLAPGAALFLRALLDFNIFDYSGIWIPAAVIAIVYVAIACRASKEFTFKAAIDYLSVLTIALIAFAYSYGVVVTLNCLFDRSAPQIFHAKVLGKRISSGKTTTYYLDLSPWGERREADEVTVSREVFNRAGVNDDVNIYFMKGRFGIPWFDVNTVTKIGPSLGR